MALAWLSWNTPYIGRRDMRRRRRPSLPRKRELQENQSHPPDKWKVGAKVILHNERRKKKNPSEKTYGTIVAIVLRKETAIEAALRALAPAERRTVEALEERYSVCRIYNQRGGGELRRKYVSFLVAIQKISPNGTPSRKPELARPNIRMMSLAEEQGDI